jgi:hypothetical protein
MKRGAVGAHRTLVATEGAGHLRLDGNCWHEMIYDCFQLALESHQITEVRLNRIQVLTTDHGALL